MENMDIHACVRFDDCSEMVIHCDDYYYDDESMQYVFELEGNTVALVPREHLIYVANV